MTKAAIKITTPLWRILLVDDDSLLRNTLTHAFEDAGFHVETAVDGEGALTKLLGESEYKIDLVILDWKMPGLSGLEVLRCARKSGVTTPVIFLTGLSEPIYEESALVNGAVDFVEKSRGFIILLKRVELILGASQRPAVKKNNSEGILIIGQLELNSQSQRALWNGKQVPLTLTEFSIVKLIAECSGVDVHFKDIYLLTYGEGFAVGYGPEGYRGNVRTYIKRIRKKFREIDDEFDAIENYPGYGYRWRRI